MKITVIAKNRLHSRQQPCRSLRQTVIGIGLRKLFMKKFACHRSEQLGGIAAASRSAFCILIIRLFSVSTFLVSLYRSGKFSKTARIARFARIRARTARFLQFEKRLPTAYCFDKGGTYVNNRIGKMQLSCIFRVSGVRNL